MIAKRRGSTLVAAALPAAAVAGDLLRAQDGTVAGTVVAQGNQRPLAGVAVAVAGVAGQGRRHRRLGHDSDDGPNGTDRRAQRSLSSASAR